MPITAASGVSLHQRVMDGAPAPDAAGDDRLPAHAEPGHGDADEPGDVGADAEPIEGGNHDPLRQVAGEDLVHQAQARRRRLLEENRGGKDQDRRRKALSRQLARADHPLRVRQRFLLDDHQPGQRRIRLHRRRSLRRAAIVGFGSVIRQGRGL
jgi:hypothetical protein